MESKKMKMNKSFKITKNAALILLSCTFFTLPLQSQVTIGSLSEPLKGSLLDLKESNESNGGANTTKGVIYPRVLLTNLDELYPMLTGSESGYQALKPSYTGLTVYNVNTAPPFGKGLYTWNGAKWIRMSAAGAKNGLSLSGSDTIKLGGTLEENTTIDIDNKNLVVESNNAQKGKLIFKSVNNATANDTVAQLAVDNKTGEVLAIRAISGNSKPFSYIKYDIICTNSNPAYRDWINDFDTQIPYKDYTVFVVGSEFSIVDSYGNEIINSGMTINTIGSSDIGNPTFGPEVAQAIKNEVPGQNPTWRLKADYKYSNIANIAHFGKWTIQCIIINNTIVQQLNNISRTTPSITWVEQSMPAGL